MKREDLEHAMTINYGLRVYTKRSPGPSLVVLCGSVSIARFCGRARTVITRRLSTRERQMRSASGAERYYECPGRRKRLDYIPLNYYSVSLRSGLSLFAAKSERRDDDDDDAEGEPRRVREAETRESHGLSDTATTLCMNAAFPVNEPSGLNVSRGT